MTKNLTSSRSRVVASQCFLAARCLLALGGVICLSGCTVGALIVGGVVAGVVLSEDNGSSKTSQAAARPFLSPPPTREILRQWGDANAVPVCFQGGGKGVGDILVEFSIEADDFSTWRRATRIEGRSSEGVCPGATTFWWDSRSDLGPALLLSQRVRIRISDGKDLADASISPSFFVGNSPPEVEFVPTTDNEGPITISFSARDQEGDGLLGVRLYYAAAPPVGAGDSSLIPLQLVPELDAELPAPDSKLIYSREWSSTQATGSHNIPNFHIFLECRDAFGVEARSELTLTLRNNNPPEARLLADSEDLSSHFAVRVPFKLFDPDPNQRVDVILQYALEGKDFPVLPTEGLLDAPARRHLLESPEAAQKRLDLQIATPSARAQSRTLSLEASEAGIEHAFVWDGSRDLAPAVPTRVRLRLTPFDEDRGVAAETPGELTVDNDLYPEEIRLSQDLGRVKGTAVGDLDSDARLDIALSLFDAPTFPGEAGCENERGRIDVYLRAVDGSLSSQPLILAPGPEKEARPCAGRPRGPTDLRISDLDHDGRNDLLAVSSNCAEEDCPGIRGEVSIFFGSSAVPPLTQFPTVVRAGGADIRAVGLGDFDGNGLPDIAVSNHDSLLGSSPIPRSVGVFLQLAPRQFTEMMWFSDCDSPECEPGLLTCADLNGDGRAEIAVRQDEAAKNRVLILEWSEVESRPILWTTVQLDSRDFDFENFLPVSVDSLDRDSNGFADLVVGSRGTKSAFVFRNRGDTTIPLFERTSKTCLSAAPEKLAIADLTGDGRPDLVALEPDNFGGAAELAELRGDGCCPETCGLKRIPLPLSPRSGTGPANLSFADLNQDGKLDLVFGSTQSAHIFLAARPGSLAPEAERVLQFDVATSLQDVLVADVNGDQLLDIAVGAARLGNSNPRYEISFFLQTQRGVLPDKPNQVLGSRPGAHCEPQQALGLAGMDLDSDGTSDVIALGRSGGVDIFWRGAEGFDDAPTLTFEDCAGLNTPANGIALGRFGGDGDVDVLRLDSREMGGNASGRLLLSTIRRRVSGGGMTTSSFDHPPMATGPAPLFLAAADLTGDGLDEVALLFPLSGEIVIFGQDATKQWPERLFVAGKIRVDSFECLLQTADLNGDGLLDLLVAPGSRKTVTGYAASEGTFPGALRFDPVFELNPGGTPTSLVFSDLNGDDFPDVAVGVDGEATLRLFPGNASGKPAPHSAWPVTDSKAHSPRTRVLSRDINDDGTPDLIIFDPDFHELRVEEAR